MDEREPEELSADDDARVRALLAEIGSTATGERVPEEVVDRLEQTLAALVAERAAAEDAHEVPPVEDDAGRVVPLRARWLPRMAVAAAAVVVLGVAGVASGALGLLTGQTTTASDSGAAGGAAAESAPQSDAGSDDKGLAPDAGDRGAVGGLASPTPSDLARYAAALPEVSAARFGTDVEELVATGALRGVPVRPLVEGCPGPADPAGVVTFVRLDGELVALVLQPDDSSPRSAAAWACDGSRQLASAPLEP